MEKDPQVKIYCVETDRLTPEQKGNGGSSHLTAEVTRAEDLVPPPGE